MADSDPKSVSLPAYPVGDLFAQTVLDVKNSIPVGVTGAIDLQLEFSSLSMSDKGFRFMYSNTISSQSSLSLKLATRIYTDTPVVPNEVIVGYVQKTLKEENLYQGQIDGVMSPEVRAAIDNAFSKAGSSSPLFNLKGVDATRKYLAYLQYALNKKLLVPIDLDGYDGPQTQRAIFSLFGDYAKSETSKPAQRP